MNCLGNNSEIDSLTNLIKQEILDTNQIKIHIELGKVYIDINIDSTYHYALLAKIPAEELNYISGIIKIYNLLGNCAQRKGDFEEAMEYYDVVKQVSIENNNDKGMAIVMNNIGIIHTQSGDYNAALKDYLIAIDYEKKINNKKGIAEGLNNIGVVHYYMGDMENTLIYLKKSMEITQEIGDLKVLKKGYINIGAIHQHNKEFIEALEFYEKGYNIAVEVNDQHDINLTLHNIAQVYVIQGKLDKAEEYYNKSLAFEEKFGNKRGVAIDYINLGNLYNKRKNFSKSLMFFNSAIQITKDNGYVKELETAFGGISEMFAESGQYEKAYNSSLEFIEIKDSLLNKENAKNFAELRTKYETVEKEKALAEEKIKTEVLGKEKAEVELKAANRSKWILGLLAIIVFVVLIFMVVVQKNKRKSQADKDAAIILERDKGTKAVFNAQEEERKRISKDLHDGVGQQLSGLKMAFQKLGSELKTSLPEKEVELEKLSQILSESADEVRSISHQMMPKALTQLGLIEAVDDMLSKSLGISQIKFQFEHFGIKERLEERIEISLYRVVQELVNNIIKHSQADTVSVQLFKNSGKVILIVEDNGTGIKGNSGDGHGLLNIKSRINTLHGEINLEPSPKSGTLATIRIPLA
jgi:signal transduction histidine kinase/Tfp pilus assembly protein PilF